MAVYENIRDEFVKRTRIAVYENIRDGQRCRHSSLRKHFPNSTLRQQFTGATPKVVLDEVHGATMERNTPGWWIVLATEQYNSMVTKDYKEIRVITVAINMPYSEKVLTSTSPFTAIAAWFDHATELQLTTTKQLDGRQ